MIAALVFPVLYSALLASSDAQPKASTGSGDPDREIVVKGRELRELVSNFVDSVLPAERGTQFGRFEDPICPQVVGLDSNAEKEIADRMALVGNAVKIDVKRQPCDPNVLLVIVPDKKAMIAQLRKSRPEYFKLVPDSHVSAMVNSSRPYASWQLSELFAADGMRIGRSDTRPGAGHLAADSKGPRFDFNSVVTKTTEPPSRLRANVKPHIQSAIIIVESRALDNVDTRQLADFTLMQAMLPDSAINEDPPKGSILGIFAELPASNDAPMSVTHADVAFLKAIRGVRADYFSLVQKNTIRSQMISELEKSNERQN